MSNILFFMPDNPAKTDSGNKTRAKAFLTYFKSRGHGVDFFSEFHWEKWTDEKVNELKGINLVNNIYIMDRKSSKKNLPKYLFIKLRQSIYNKIKGINSRVMPNHATYYLLTQFRAIIKNKQYDYVFINYATWAYLVYDKKILKGARTIIDTHDFIASQRQNSDFKRTGKTFGEELKRLNFFDNIWAISPEEHYIFSQFLGNDRVKLVPMMAEKKILTDATQPAKYDIIYVASDNDFNRAAAKWFINEVYPLLSEKLRICIIGKICPHVNVEGKDNIEKIHFVEDLDACYRSARIAICPMLGGTGLKIKIVEALSFGLPIVCNERGLDGIPNKLNNGCLVTNDPAKFAENIHLLMDNEEEYKRYKRQALDLFETYFEQEICYKQLDNYFK